MKTSLHLFESRRIVYVEVPKAGCTSIKWALRGQRGEWYGEPDASFHSWFGYSRFDSDSIGGVLGEQFRGWRTFTVVRDPYDRFVSLYHGILRASRDWKGRHCGSIGEFARRFAESGWAEDVHGRPQTQIIGCDLSVYDFVGRTEDMDAVFEFIQSEFQLASVPQVRCNRSEPTESLSDVDREVLWPVFERDFEVLGYSRSGQAR